MNPLLPAIVGDPGVKPWKNENYNGRSHPGERPFARNQPSSN